MATDCLEKIVPADDVDLEVMTRCRKRRGHGNLAGQMKNPIRLFCGNHSTHIIRATHVDVFEPNISGSAEPGEIICRADAA